MADAFTTRRYVTAFNKLKSMLTDRGINTDSVVKTENDFSEDVEAGKTMIGSKFVKEDESLQLVILHLGGKMTLKSTTEILSQIANHRTLIVYQSSITPQARTMLINTHQIELHEEDEFLKLSRPEHVLSVASLNLEEKQQFLAQFNITEEMIPEEKEENPLAKYYGLLAGDVAKITEVRDGSRFVTFRRIIRP